LPSSGLLIIDGNLLAGAGSAILTRGQLLALIRSRDGILDDDDDDDWGPLARRRRRRSRDPNRFPKVPSEKGTELMHSGVFGANEPSTRNSVDQPIKLKKDIARRVLDRELGLGNPRERLRNQALMAQVNCNRIPAKMIIALSSVGSKTGTFS
jgi:DDB1- and CUL4-associated factor 11